VSRTEDVGWGNCLDDLSALAVRLSDKVLAAGDPGRHADLAVKMFGATMGAYLGHLWADPDHPAFLPSVGYYQMYGSPNPDTVYRTAVIDGAAEYLITGHRGSVPDVTVMPFGAPTATGLQTFAPFDLNQLATHDDGTFDVLLSGQRPADQPNWWRLEEGMRTLMLRSVSEEWGAHTEPRLAIVRLDGDPRRARFSPDVLRQRLGSFAAVVEAMMMSGINRVSQLRSDDVVNRLVEVDYSSNGGLGDQWYHEGCFDLDDDEVLLVEARIPPDCRTFSLSLTDPFFSTIDWTNAQSSLNRRQSVMEADGVLRAVVSATDPGVQNWLDTTGHEFGVLQCRWMGSAEAPEVSVRVVATAALDQLNPRMPRVTAQERAQAIRGRQVGVQLRSRW
jgi:hypothetical protein